MAAIGSRSCSPGGDTGPTKDKQPKPNSPAAKGKRQVAFGMVGFSWFFLVFCRPGVLTRRGFGGSITKADYQDRSPRPITKADQQDRLPRPITKADHQGRLPRPITKADHQGQLPRPGETPAIPGGVPGGFRMVAGGPTRPLRFWQTMPQTTETHGIP